VSKIPINAREGKREEKKGNREKRGMRSE